MKTQLLSIGLVIVVASGCAVDSSTRGATALVMASDSSQALLMSVTGAPGHESIGDIELQFVFGPDLRQAHSLILVRDLGSDSAESPCVNGKVIATFTPPNEAHHHTLKANQPGETLDLRACIIDGEGKVIGSGYLSGLAPKSTMLSSTISGISNFFKKIVGLFGG